MFTQKTSRAHWLLAGTLLFSISALAQGGKGEVVGFGGGTSLSGGAGTHGLFGGSAGARLTDHMHVFGEFAVVPLATASATMEGVTANGSEKLYNFGGGVDYSFGSSERAVPYVLVAGGLSHDSASATANAAGYTVTVGASANAAYYGAGGGMRLYIGKKWGIKPEVRFQRYTGSGSSTIGVDFAVGLFYQFGQ